MRRTVLQKLFFLELCNNHRYVYVWHFRLGHPSKHVLLMKDAMFIFDEHCFESLQKPKETQAPIIQPSYWISLFLWEKC